MDRPTCGTCPYWDNDGGTIEREPAGFCRRHSPRLAAGDKLLAEMGEKGMWYGLWPITPYYDWCGDHPGWAEHMDRFRHVDRRPEVS